MRTKQHAWGINLAIATILLAGLTSDKAHSQTSDLVSANALRVCADPSNEPMSDEHGNGYENKIAELIARELDLTVEYTWFPMSVGFIRNTLAANRCDVVIGYAQGHELVLNTNHYLTSIYTLIVPEGSLADVEKLSDERLKGLRIGIVAGTPPSSHMIRHGLMAKAKPYQLHVDTRVTSSTHNMLADLNEREIDAAILWGPLGGPVAKQLYPEFKVIPLVNEPASPRMFFRITMGVRRGEVVWKRKLNSLIRRNQAEIDMILRDAGVPLMNDMGTAYKE